MCTNKLLYVTNNLQYKKINENDQIKHYLEERGTGSGLITGQRQNFHWWAGATFLYVWNRILLIQHQIHQMGLRLNKDLQVTQSIRQIIISKNSVWALNLVFHPLNVDVQCIAYSFVWYVIKLICIAPPWVTCVCVN